MLNTRGLAVTFPKRISQTNVYVPARTHPRSLFARAGAKPRSHQSQAWVFVKVVAGFGLATHIFSEYGYSLEWTWGISMVPNLASNGDVVIISKHYRRGRGVQVGDLVSFTHPVDEKVLALKRVLAMPGDFVVRDAPHRGKQMMVQIPAGHCYVVGDNLEHSRDSRLFGPLPLALVKGKVLCIIGKGDKGKIAWPRRIPGGLEDPRSLGDDEGVD